MHERKNGRKRMSSRIEGLKTPRTSCSKRRRGKGNVRGDGKKIEDTVLNTRISRFHDCRDKTVLPCEFTRGQR